jgi:hypothetical protein
MHFGPPSRSELSHRTVDIPVDFRARLSALTRLSALIRYSMVPRRTAPICSIWLFLFANDRLEVACSGPLPRIEAMPLAGLRAPLRSPRLDLRAEARRLPRPGLRPAWSGAPRQPKREHVQVIPGSHGRDQGPSHRGYSCLVCKRYRRASCEKQMTFVEPCSA